jgi:hypothetical protein
VEAQEALAHPIDRRGRGYRRQDGIVVEDGQ